MEYKLQDIKIEAKKGEALKVDDLIVELKDRKVAKIGEVYFLSLSDLEENIKHNTKTKKEVVAKQDNERAKKENIEHFHPFVLDMSPQDLHTAYLYKESSDWVKSCQSQIEALDKQINLDKEEIEEIKKQVPELKEVEISLPEENIKSIYDKE